MKDIVKCIEAGVWHTHEVGTDEQVVEDLVGLEVVGDLVGPAALTKQVFH